MPGPAPRTGGTMTGGPADDATRLKARLAALEADHRRAFVQAQHEADALFAQYQLCQLIASGGSPSELGGAVVNELVRLAGADSGAIWLGRRATRGSTCSRPPGPWTTRRRRSSRMSPTAGRYVEERPDLRLVVLGEEPPATLLVLRVGPSGELDADGLRVAQLARHELAVAFGEALLREALERERHELSAVVEGATDVILQVDEARRVVRLNPAGERALGTSTAEAARTDLRRRPRLRRGGRPRRRRLPARRGHLVGRVDRLSRDRDPVGRRRVRPRRGRLLASAVGARRCDPGDGDPPRHQRRPGARGAARRLRRDGEPRAPDAARARPRLRRDPAPLRPGAGPAARVHRPDPRA